MDASPNLVLLNGELVEFSEHLETTAKTVDDVRDIISDVRNILEIPKDIRKASKQLKKTADSGGAIAKVLSKVGFLKPIARPFEKTMYEVSDTFKAIDKKAAELEIKFKPYIAKMKTAEKKLKKTKKQLEDRAEDTEELADHVEQVNTRLNIVKAVADNPNIPLPAALEARLSDIFNIVNGTANVANRGLIPLNDTMEAVEEKVQELRDLLSIPEFQGLLDFVNLLKSIQDSISDLADPLESVYDAAGPVIDALGSIFGFILAPLEAILDAVLEATGIEDLLKEASAFILDLLPDIGVLQSIADALEAALDVQFDTLFNLGINNPLDGLLAQLDPLQFLTAPGLGLGDPTSGDDVILGQFGSLVGDTVAASDGDDIIIGSRFDDVLNGGSGSDLFIATEGNDTINGGESGNDRDVVVFSGHSDDYAIRSEIGDDGRSTGRWTVSDYTFGSATPDGYNTLIDIEDIVFTDRTFAIGDIDNLVRTRSLDGSFGDVPGSPNDVFPPNVNYNPATGVTFPNDGFYGYYVSTTYSTVREVGGPNETITNIADKDDPTKFPLNPKSGPLQYTVAGVDLVLTGFGYDRIFAGAGNDQIEATANGPVSVALGYPGDELWGEEDNDLFLIGAGEGIYDIVRGGTGTDSVVYQAVDTPSPTGSTGISIFMASANLQYNLFRPTEFPIDIDFLGRAQSDPALPRLGVIRGVENLNLTQFDDHVWGSEDSNILLGGAGNDQIRGLGGDDIIRGGEGNDTLIGDRGDDLLDGGTGSTEFVGGHGSDTMRADASPAAFNTVIYGMSDNLTGSFYNTGFVEFADRGYQDLDLPNSIAVYSSAERGKNWVSKYDANGDLLGQDQIYNIDVIVGSTGNDNITGALGINQLLHGHDGDDFIAAGDGTSIDDEDNEAESTGARVRGGFGDDTLMPSFGSDNIQGDEGSDSVIIGADQSVDGDYYNGDNSLNARTEGIDTLDLSGTIYSWRLYLRDGSGAGDIYGKFPLSIADAEDHKYIQPTAGVDGIVPVNRNDQQPGDREGVNFELRVPDANTPNPGGRASVESFEIFKMSEQRDIVAVGSHENAITVYGYGGDDVLYSAQTFSDSLFGGEGDDVLGTYNQSIGTESYASRFNVNTRILLDGADGNDTFVGGDAQETFVGGFGIDELTYEAGRGGVTVDLETGRGSGGYAEGDRFTSMENLIGSVDDDILTGDSGTNIIEGWTGNDTISGNFGDDLLYGNAGDDVISGGDGNDQLHGGLGADTLDGGTGIDTAIYSELQNHPKDNEDRLIGPPTGVEVDLLARTGAGDTLWNIENVTGSLGSDTITGDNDDNLLAGEDGDDILDGGAGADILEGGDGNDTLRGGTGDDWFNGGAGINEIDGGAGFDVLDYGSLIFSVNIEMAGVGSRAGNPLGLATKQVAQPRVVWSDSLPEDFDIQAADQADVLVGTDEIRYTRGLISDRGTDDPSDDLYEEQAAEITPERILRLNPTFARHPDDLLPVRFLNEDDLLDSQQITVLTRYETATDSFTGIDKISGGAGDDSIRGNDENTEFHGGAGADTIDGGGGNDTVSYAGSEAAVQINLATFTATGGDAAGDLLSAVENLTGSHYGDELRGNALGNELLGGGGSDSLYGGAGEDTAVYTFASDAAIVSFADGGMYLTRLIDGQPGDRDFIASDVEAFRFTDGTFTLAEMQARVVQGDAGDNALIGTELSEIIPGFAGSDRIEARGGNDTLRGGSENDTLLGEDGDDVLDGGIGADSMSGGDGDDTYRVDNAGDLVFETGSGGTDTVESSISRNLSANIENLVLTGTGNIDGTGNGLGNSMTGNAGNNALNGGSGVDTALMTGTLAAASLDFTRIDYFTVTTAAGGTDRLSDIEFIRFDDGLFSVADLRQGVAADDGIRLNATGRFENGFAIDISREGGGAQFLNIGPASEGSDYRNRLHFTTEFEDQGGRAYYNGQNFNRPREAQPDNARVNGISVDFEGGNTPDVSIDGLDLAANDIIPADWAFFETNVFQGSDRMVGSYFADHLLGYAGNDTIFGGLGDKEKYNVDDLPHPSPRPTPFRNAGEATTDPGLWVDDGADTLDGDAGDDLIDGGTGGDLLLGGAGADEIWGGGDAGNDTLDGGSGNDTLHGGAGEDVAVFANFRSTDVSVARGSDNALLISTAEGVDHVDADIELFRFVDGTFARAHVEGLIRQGTDAAETLEGTANNDTLEALGGDDRLDGRAGADSLDAGTGNDTLIGGAGNDTLNGGLGEDAFSGGGDDDFYIVDSSTEVVSEGPNSGQDHVQTTVSFVLPSHVEEMSMPGTGNINGTGNALDNVLGGSQGNNLLQGLDGNDTILGAPGADTLEGGAGDDSLLGGGGVDQLSGGDGDDHLDGGLNGDQMAGGAGDDTYRVDAADDVVTEAENGGHDHVMSTISRVLSANVEDLTLLGGTDATGNALDNVLTGNAAANRLVGLEGDDKFFGGDGDDTVRIETTVDRVAVAETATGIYIASTQGVDFVSYDVEYIEFQERLFTPEGAKSLLAQLAGTEGDDVLIGTPLADRFLSGAGNDRIEGRAGDDSLEGEAGNDTLAGEEGNDVLLGGTGDDDLSGGAGADLVVGGDGNDTMQGGVGDDTLDGKDGADAAAGNAGDDLYIVDDAADTVTEIAGEGNDSVHSSVSYTLSDNVENLLLTGTGNADGTGNAGDNRLAGNAFDNRLTGGAGNDTATGGAGEDTFVFGLSRTAVRVVEVSQQGVTVQSAEGQDFLSADIENFAFTDGTITYDELTELGQRTAYVFYLDGAQVETPVSTDATGVGYGVYDPINDVFTYSLRVNGLDWGNLLDGGVPRTAANANDDVTTAHIHVGGTGNSGGVAFGLIEDAQRSDILNADGTRTISGAWDNTDGNPIASFGRALGGTAPGSEIGLYFNVHTIANGGGEIRGQLLSIADDTANLIAGRANVDDVLTGLEGADTILGDSGNDLLIGNEGADSLSGGDGNDTLSGGDGNDDLQGDAGNDALDGGAGIDTMTGGAGNDAYYADGSDIIVEAPGGGIDTVYVTLGVSSYRIAENVENLTVQVAPGFAEITDNALDNVIDGGADRSPPNSVFIFASNGGNDAISNGHFIFAGDGADTLTGLDQNGVQLHGEDGADVMNGGAGDEWLFGGRGEDTIDGGAGNDLIWGSDSNISVLEDAGNDSLAGGDGNDTIYGGKADTEETFDPTVLDGDDTIDGGAGDDMLVAGTGNDVLDGGEGTDTMIGGAGNDVIRGGGGTADVAVFNVASIEIEVAARGESLIITSADGVDEVHNSVERLQFRDGSLTFAQVQAFVPVTGDTRGGTAGGDVLIGTPNADTLNGLGGDDSIDGRAGADILIGGPGNDELNGNTGRDTAVFESPADHKIDLRIANTPQDTGEGLDVLVNIENLSTADGNDRLYGDSNANVLSSGAGDDRLYGDGVKLTEVLDDAARAFRLYQATLGREPDAAGHLEWTTRLSEGTFTSAQAAGGFVGSQEFQNVYGALDDSGFVIQLYRNVLEREPSEGEVNAWLNLLNTGLVRADVVLGFVDSPEFVRSTTAEANAFAAAHTDMNWVDDIFRVYQATLDRAPDLAGLKGWIALLGSGAAFEDAVNGFVGSPEFQITYGALDNTGFVELLYTNVLGRDADAGGLAGWLDVLTTGGTRAQVVEGFSQSPEFVASTAQPLLNWVRTIGQDDTLIAGSGTNTLMGGALSDTFVFDAAQPGTNTVLDFEAWDKLEFRGFGYDADAQVLANLSRSGADTVFSDQGVTVTFQGVDPALFNDEMIL